MRLLRYLKRQRSLLAEVETLRTENAALREALLVERLFWSWVRRKSSAKPLLLLEKQASKRPDPHVVPVGRHARAEPVTEVHPRVRRTP